MKAGALVLSPLLISGSIKGSHVGTKVQVNDDHFPSPTQHIMFQGIRFKTREPVIRYSITQGEVYMPKYTSHPVLGGNCDFKDFQMDSVPFGMGNFGSVHRALHKPTNKIFALKNIDIASILMLSMISTEETWQHDLKHKYIGEIYCAMKPDSNSAYLVMDYYPKGDLMHVSKCRKLKKSELSEIIAQLLTVVRFIHENGGGHFDIKPENILLDGNNNIKLIDFGLAAKDTENKLKDINGTPMMMAPEIFGGKGYGRAADYYSIAASIYVLFTGKFLVDSFDGVTDIKLIRPPKIPATGLPDVDEVISILGAHDPTTRWRDAYDNFGKLKKLEFFRGTQFNPQKSFQMSFVVIVIGVVLGAGAGAGFIIYKMINKKRVVVETANTV